MNSPTHAPAEAEDAERVGSETPGAKDGREEAEAARRPGADEEHDGFPAEIALSAHAVDSIRRRISESAELTAARTAGYRGLA